MYNSAETTEKPKTCEEIAALLCGGAGNNNNKEQSTDRPAWMIR